jgi:hypothetical protein
MDMKTLQAKIGFANIFTRAAMSAQDVCHEQKRQQEASIIMAR